MSTDPNPGAAPGAKISTPSFVFGAKSQKGLVVSIRLISYYEIVVLPTSAANVQWNPVMKNFKVHWKAPKEKKNRYESEVSNTTKALPIIK